MFKDEEYKELKIVDFGIAGSDVGINVDQTFAGSARYFNFYKYFKIFLNIENSGIYVRK